MAGVVSDESGAGRSVEGIANGQHCQSGEALAEWRSSEQLENGTPSTSPPFWDTDDEDDDDAGPRPSELYGKHTWKIEKFSQINKRELRSNAFEVGGYKWYILIYPQGCDVCNHLSLFLCVANHEKLLPGWSHFAQFTIAVVNKDLKKSKYSDTLHRFWKKEHDWGWKKFMELSKVFDGFIDADTLIIKAQVQVIRERADRPFRCLDCQYRRELVRVYLTNVEQICRRFVEDSRGKLEALIEDKAKWSSFCAFWLGIDQNSRRRMSREKTDVILKVVVKHFFIEKEVTSTLVMDSLYSGLKALEGHVKCSKGKLKFLDTDEMPAPIIHVENDTFVLVDDVLLLLERIALEPLPPKDEKAPQNRTKDGNFGEDFSKDSIERDERRLTVLGRRTVEIFVLAHIFSNKIEVAYQEAVALKRQEELIREEEAAWLAESEQKAKRASEKEKKSKKKQGKQKRNSRKSKDKAREEKSSIAELLKPQEEDHGYVKEAITLEEIHTVAEKSDPPEDASDVSDSMEGVNEELLPDSEDQDASPVNWDTDTSEIHMPTEASSSELNGLSCVGSANTDKKNSSTVDDSSSTCSTDSVPSVVGGPYRGGNSSEHQNKNLPSRGRSQRSKATSDGSDWALETDGQLSQAVPDRGDHDDASVSSKVCESESDAVVSSSSTDQIKGPVQQTSFEEEAVQKNIGNKEPLDSEKAKERLSVVVSSSPGIPKNPVPPIQFRSEYRCGVLTNLVPIKKVSLNSSQTDLVASSSISSQSAGLRKSKSQKAVTSKPAEKSITPQVMSRPSSAPLIPASRPTPPVVPLIHTAPSISRSVSAVGRLGPDTLPAIHSHVPLSYRNAIMGNHVGPSSGLTHSSSSSSGVSSLPAYSQPSSLASGRDTDSVQSSFPFGVVARDSSSNGSQWIDNSQRDATSRLMHRDSPSLVNSIQDFDLRRAVYSGSREQLSNDFLACTSGRHTQGAMADEFPHLDIINDLLNEENGIGKASRVGTSVHSISSGSPLLNRQFSFPPDTSMSGELGSPSSSSCRFERTQSYHEDEFQHGYSSLSGQFNGFAEYIPQVAGLHYANGQMEGLVPAQWRMTSSDLSLLTMRHAEGDSYHYFGPEYSNLACGVNGYSVFRPSK